MGPAPGVVSDKDAFSAERSDDPQAEETMSRHLTPDEFLLPPVAATQSCSNVNLKTKGAEEEGKQKLNEHVGIWEEGHLPTPAVPASPVPDTLPLISSSLWRQKDIAANCLRWFQSQENKMRTQRGRRPDEGRTGLEAAVEGGVMREEIKQNESGRGRKGQRGCGQTDGGQRRRKEERTQ